MENYYEFKHKESFRIVIENKIGRLEFNKLENTLSMKNLKEGLIQYLEKNGKQEDVSYRELYDMYPFDGYNLTNKQQGDRVRSIWKKVKKENSQQILHSIYDAKRCAELKYNPDDYEWVTNTSNETKIKTGLDNWSKEEYKHFSKNKPYYKGNAITVSSELPDLTLTPTPEATLESIVTIGGPGKKTTQAYHKTGKVTTDFQMGTTALPEVIAEPIRKEAKILVYDLECSPLRAYTWSLWKQNINPTNGQLQSQKMILSWSAKWLYENKIMSDHLFPDEIQLEDDGRIAKSLWDLINEADIVIAHNASGFDVKVMNTRFLLAGLPPPKHYQVIDTLLHARKRFKLESNKLDYIAQVLGFGNKLSTGGFKLWVDCMNGDRGAMANMVEYCEKDVLLLEDVYLALRSWIKPHPPVNLITDNFQETTCPVCNSSDTKEYGTYTTYANIYPAHKCNNCHSTFRSRKAKKLDKTNLTISTPN